MSPPPVNSLPPPSSAGEIQDAELLVNDWRTGGIQLVRKRAEGQVPVTTSDPNFYGQPALFEVVWEPATLGLADAIRQHHAAFFTQPFDLVFPCRTDPERVVWDGPLTIDHVSNTTVRVRAIVARAFPAFT